MQLSKRHADIINTLYERNLDLARGDDDQRRKLTKMIAEQIRLEFGSDWGTKASSRTNPQSKDAIAFRLNSQTMDVWDWQNGTTREPQVGEGSEPTYPMLTGQYFIEVDAVDHLSSVPDNGDEEEDPLINILVELKNDLKDVRADVTRLLNSQAALMESHIDIIQRLQILIDKPSPDLPFITFPEYEASTFFGRITLKPKK